jgi:hypothetical protein
MSEQTSDYSTREILYGIYYAVAFMLSMYFGLKNGFTDTHTPPVPFVVELFVIPVGGILYILDALMHRSTTVHKIGFTANCFIMIVVLALAFN